MVVESSLICYLFAPRPTLGHHQRDSVNHCIIQLQLKSHMDPYNMSGFLTLAEHLVAFEQEAFLMMS